MSRNLCWLTLFGAYAAVIFFWTIPAVIITASTVFFVLLAIGLLRGIL